MNEFENHIKQKLEERRLSPSQSAWSQLERRLDEKPKSSPKLWWLVVAASFLLGIGLSGWFFSQQSLDGETNSRLSNRQQLPAINATPAQVETLSFQDSIEPVLMPEKSGLAVQVQRKPVATTPNIKPFSDTKSSLHPDLPSAVSSHQIPAEKQEMVPDKTTEEMPVEQDNLNRVIAGIVAKVQTESETHQVTDAEINQLIRQAQLRLRAEKAFASSDNEIDAMALLQEVEHDLDKSLKERVFQAIKLGLDKAKILLASRR